jgi:hypothetical protein
MTNREAIKNALSGYLDRDGPGGMIGGRKLRDIGDEDADDYVESRDDLEPKTIANHLTLLISMFNYAAEVSSPTAWTEPTSHHLLGGYSWQGERGSPGRTRGSQERSARDPKHDRAERKGS